MDWAEFSMFEDYGPQDRSILRLSELVKTFLGSVPKMEIELQSIHLSLFSILSLFWSCEGSMYSCAILDSIDHSIYGCVSLLSSITHLIISFDYLLDQVYHIFSL